MPDGDRSEQFFRARTPGSGAEHTPAPRPGRYPPPRVPPRAPGRRSVPSPAQQRLMDRVASARRARRQRAILVTCGLISALVLVVSGGAWAITGYVNGGFGRVDAGTAGTPPSGPLNILVAGVDRRAGLTVAQENELHVGHDVSANSDTMMLVHVSADHNSVTVVSLPRDSWVNIPGHGMNKINAAYGLGGPKLMVQAVEQATGVTIDNYIEVNFLGFVRVIDALGGVDICLPQPVSDPDSGLFLTAGTHHVDGITALKYARDRHSFASEDLARIDNQQRILASLLSQAISGGTLANPVRLSSFLTATLAAVKVDSGLNVAALADRMRGISPRNVSFTTAPIANANFMTPSGESAVLWDTQAASQLFGAINRDRPLIKPAPKSQVKRTSLRIDVYNGTLIGGLSAETGAQLTQLGFQVRAGLTWPRQDILRTTIFYPPGQQAAAGQVRAVLPAASLKRQAGLQTIRVVLGVNGHDIAAPASPSPAASGQIKAVTAAQNACR
jgi:LCP family protein required for cell wall assembly